MLNVLEASVSAESKEEAAAILSNVRPKVRMFDELHQWWSEAASLLSPEQLAAVISAGNDAWLDERRQARNAMPDPESEDIESGGGMSEEVALDLTTTNKT